MMTQNVWSLSTLIISAFFLDLAMGDPRWLPHPVRIMGKGIAALEAFLRRRFARKRELETGIILVIVIVVAVFVLSFMLQKLLLSFSNRGAALAGAVVLVYLMSTTLALRDLVASADKVIAAVKDRSLDRARNHLAMIVGRDTETLSEEGVLRAAIETLAENLSDGFIAPLFYLVLGGLPLAMAYKAINTLDSMVGYKNERYIRFGRAAARLDDMANYVPARIAGLCIVAAVLPYLLARDAKNALQGAATALRIMLRDGRNHASPNSGVPEAAMAGALGIQLGGPSTYNGVVVTKPSIGEPGSIITVDAADQAKRLVIIASFVAVACAVLTARLIAGG